MLTSWLIGIMTALLTILGLMLWAGPENISLQPGLQLYLTEAILLFVIAGLLFLRSTIVRPLHSLMTGIDLLKGQDFSSRLATVGNGDVDRIAAMFNEMIRQLKYERVRLREQNHFLDLIISASPMGIVILDHKGKITMANPTIVGFFDCTSADEVTGHTLRELSSPLARFIASLERYSTASIRLSDAMIYRCSSLTFMDNGYTHPFILVERLTDEVMKAEKKAYEKVIRIMAHEVNNSAGGINSSLDTAASILDEEPDPALHDIAAILRLCRDRSRALSDFTTSFAQVVKIPEAVPVRCSLNERITASHIFLESLCRPSGTELRLRLSDKNPEIMADSVLLEQALINIIKNAVESIASTGKPGTVEISTAADPPRLTVTDCGAGISEEAKEQIFTPFYTSKPSGHGLGLILIVDVLRKHGCRFSLTTSEEDGLTRFDIRFPYPGQFTDNKSLK